VGQHSSSVTRLSYGWSAGSLCTGETQSSRGRAGVHWPVIHVRTAKVSFTVYSWHISQAGISPTQAGHYGHSLDRPASLVQCVSHCHVALLNVKAQGKAVVILQATGESNQQVRLLLHRVSRLIQLSQL